MVATINSESRGNDALPVCLCPWLENPYGLVSLWEMERFAGESLHDAIRILDSIRYTWWFAAPAGDAAAALMMGQERVLTLDERRSVEESLRHVEVNIRRSGLLTSGEAITKSAPNSSVGIYPALENCLRERLRSESTTYSEQFGAR